MAIIDLDDDGTASARPPRAAAVIALGAVALSLGILGVGILLTAAPPPRTLERSASAPVTLPPAPLAIPVAAWMSGGMQLVALALPPDVSDADLSVIPERVLNDPPPPHFRLPVTVRGTAGLASVEGPAAVVWTERGHWYQLGSTVRTIGELLDLASALR